MNRKVLERTEPNIWQRFKLCEKVGVNIKYWFPFFVQALNIFKKKIQIERYIYIGR